MIFDSVSVHTLWLLAQINKLSEILIELKLANLTCTISQILQAKIQVFVQQNFQTNLFKKAWMTIRFVNLWKKTAFGR